MALRLMKERFEPAEKANAEDSPRSTTHVLTERDDEEEEEDDLPIPPCDPPMKNGLAYIITAAEMAEDIRRSFALKMPEAINLMSSPSKAKSKPIKTVTNDPEEGPHGHMSGYTSRRYPSSQYRTEETFYHSRHGPLYDRYGHRSMSSPKYYYKEYSKSPSLSYYDVKGAYPRHSSPPPHHHRDWRDETRGDDMSYMDHMELSPKKRKSGEGREPSSSPRCDMDFEYTEPHVQSKRQRPVQESRDSGKQSNDSAKSSKMKVLKWTEQQAQDWEDRYQLLCEFNEEYGHTRVPRMGYNRGKYRGLGRWVEKQRANYIEKSPILTQDQIDKLNAIGFVWVLCPRVDWDERFEQVVQFKRENGHTRIPRYYNQDEGLGRWVDRQRNMYNSGKLSVKRMKKLEDLGFSFSPHSDYFESRLSELTAYKEKFGHVNVPRNYENKELANWVCNARYRKLTPEQTAKLEALGFRWPKSRTNDNEAE